MGVRNFGIKILKVMCVSNSTTIRFRPSGVPTKGTGAKIMIVAKEKHMHLKSQKKPNETNFISNQL